MTRASTVNDNYSDVYASQNLGASNYFSVDPFSDPVKFFPSLTNALLATALFRCWHILVFFSAWATAVCIISNSVYDLSIQPTLLTV